MLPMVGMCVTEQPTAIVCRFVRSGLLVLQDQ